ncbi:N-acetyltransferase domain-containing protein [Trichoderma simmonsii]|uniref:N-acetyltransferase domain-containing protein n=1 Tax=Trichoderma simmonsii TaxID=1491479 RepID=A0A8G0LRI1_9HYPO|nr:N-acetyltransferase domain-containing protein [Trichoderma simmonsii]
MPLQLEDMKFGDAEAYANTYATSFNTDPYSRASFADQTYDERVAGLIRRWPKNYCEALNAYKKVVDTDTGELVGWVKIGFQNTDIDPDRFTPADAPEDIVRNRPPPPEAPTAAPEGSGFSSRAARAQFRDLGNRPAIVLKLIGTHPKAQRRGAGSLLMAWVTELADQEGLACWVTGSPMAVPLYKKFGFQVMEEITVDLPGSSDGETYTHTCMLREPKKPEATA